MAQVFRRRTHAAQSRLYPRVNSSNILANRFGDFLIEARFDVIDDAVLSVGLRFTFLESAIP